MQIVFGWRKDKYDKKDYLHTRKFIVLPDKVSLANLLTSIRDQGNVGSCVGHGIGINLNSVKKGLGIFEEWCSPTFIYNGARYIEGTLPFDIGCEPRDALDWTLDYGILLEHFWPYDPTKVDAQAPSTKRINEADRYKGFAYFRAVDGVDGLCDALASGYFVSIGTPWFSEWMSSPPCGRLPKPTINSSVAGGHETCLTKDTKISLLDGRECSIEQLIDEYKDKSFWVYSCDKNQNIVPGKAHHIRSVGRRPILQITLDNGEMIKCTHDHKFLLRDGTYKQASELIVSDSLMPLYRKVKFGKYEMVMHPSTQKYELTHHLIASSLLEKFINKSEDKIIIHHKDFNSRNNNPENLEYMTWGDHTKKHQELISLINKSTKARERSRELMNKLWEDKHEMMYEKALRNAAEYRERASKEGKLGFQDKEKYDWPSMQEKAMLKIRGSHPNLSTEERLQRSLRMKQYWIENQEEMLQVAYKASLVAASKPITEKQKFARRNNILIAQLALGEKRQNHTIINIEEKGVEDVYDLTVDEYNNFALSAGIFVHNCLYGYDRIEGIFLGVNSWGTKWGDSGKYLMPFEAIDVFKAKGGYDGHYITFTSIIDPTPPNPPTPSPCLHGNNIAKFLNIFSKAANRKGRFYYLNP